MKACALLNLTASSGILAALAFSGCGGSQTPAEPPSTSSAEHGDPILSADPNDDMEPRGSGDARSEDEAGPRTEAQSASPARAPAAKEEDSRTVEVIADEVKLHREEARRCYDKLQKSKNFPAGDVVVNFTLNPNGSVKETSLNEERSTLRDTELFQCVASVIKGIKFPASSRRMETSVNYPFNFNPR